MARHTETLEGKLPLWLLLWTEVRSVGSREIWALGLTPSTAQGPLQGADNTHLDVRWWMRFLCELYLLMRLGETPPLPKKREEQCWENKTHSTTDVHTSRVFVRAFYEPVTLLTVHSSGHCVPDSSNNKTGQVREPSTSGGCDSTLSGRAFALGVQAPEGSPGMGITPSPLTENKSLLQMSACVHEQDGQGPIPQVTVTPSMIPELFPLIATPEVIQSSHLPTEHISLSLPRHVELTTSHSSPLLDNFLGLESSWA